MMKGKTYILLSLTLITIFGSLAIWNFSANSVSAQKADADEDLGVVTEYNARDEFALTQGGATGVWNYGYSTSDADNTMNLFSPATDADTIALCSGVFDRWRINNPETVPQIARYNQAATCLNIPPNALFIHPGKNNQRAILRFNAPASGTFQITGTFQKQALNATSDLKIIKNAALPGETVLYTGVIGAVYQQAFNFTVSVAAGDKIDFSVGDDGNNDWTGDGSSIAVTIGQPTTACITAPANLQVNVPAENSPTDVQSVNTNASLVGDAGYTNTGKVGRVFEFDGNGDYVRIEDNAAQRPATAVTVEGWFKFDSVAGVVSLISKPIRNSPLNSYTLYLDGGQLRGLVGNASQYTRALSNFTPPTGVWQHLAFTYDFNGGASILRLYANGTEVTNGQDGTANLPIFYDANPYPLLIGGEFENNAPGFFLDGQADEISVYGRALSQGEIFGIVRRGSFGKCSPAVCAQSPNNLVSWFAGEQNALDSRSNNHGTNNGATFTTGKVGQAFNFNGASGNFISFGNTLGNFGTSDFAVEFWMQTSNNRLEQIISKRAGCTGGEPAHFSIRKLPTGRLVVELYDGFGQVVTFDSNRIITDGLFHYVTVQRNGNSLQLYIDGVLDNSGTGAASFNLTNNGQFSIGGLGCAGVDGTETFTGVIDEVSLYNRALTTTEISSICNAGQSGKCKPVGLNPAANLVGFWTGDGDVRDSLGANPNGILRGDTNFRVGRVGQAFNLDGNGDYIEIPDDPDHRPANDVTVEGWFNVRSINDSHFVSKPLVGSNSNSYVVWYDGGVMRAGHGDQSGNFETLSTSFSPNLNTWYHFAYTVDDANNVHRFYINGAEIASSASTLPLFYDAVNPHPLLIGAEYGPPATPYSFVDGQMDEISLYSRALTASEIAAVYNAGAAGKVKAKSVIVLPPLLTKTRGAKSNVLLPPASVQLSDATVSFVNVTSSGTISENNLDLGSLPRLPSNVIFTGLAYDISTTADYQNGSADDVQVCFNAPSLAALTFANLRILHLESGVWVNRTAAGNTSPNLCTDNLTSLSPFVIVQSLAPTAANVSVSGRVGDASGFGISGVIVTLTDSQGRSVSSRTNNFGRYSFSNVSAGDVYIVSVASKRYEFAVSSQAVNVIEAIDSVDFTANSSALR